MHILKRTWPLHCR